jgi:hypothetical protein
LLKQVQLHVLAIVERVQDQLSHADALPHVVLLLLLLLLSQLTGELPGLTAGLARVPFPL